MTFFRTVFIFIVSATLLDSSSFAQSDPKNPSELVSGDTVVLVGDPGNEPYLRKNYELWGTPVSLGSVDHLYRIGKYEVTVGDWQQFLQAVASRVDSNGVIDAYGLWNVKMQGKWIERKPIKDCCKYDYIIKEPEFEKLPITFVSFYHALFYINWKEHGSPILERGADVDSILKHGSYEFIEFSKAQGEINAAIIPNEQSHFYLSSHDEWIKAAYYNPNKLGSWYWKYPTQHDSAPSNNSWDLANRANYQSTFLPSTLPKSITPVDFFKETTSYYGCCDMGGNVNEWTYSSEDGNKSFIVRGGSYESYYYNNTWYNDLHIAAIPKSYSPDTKSPTIGFRIALREEEAINTGTQKNTITADLIDKIKAHGVGWSSAESYNGSFLAKNIFYCCLPKRIIRNYTYAVPTNMDPSILEQCRDKGSYVVNLGIYKPQRTKSYKSQEIENRAKLREQGRMTDANFIFNVLEKEPRVVQNELTRAIASGKQPGDSIHYSFEMNSSDLFFKRTILPNFIEIPKQLIVGGLLGLVLGASCEYSAKYLGEGIGYLAEGKKGAQLGETIGENIGALAGMILPYVIFI